MRIKKTSGTAILTGNVVDNLDGSSTVNAPSINAVNTEFNKLTTYSTTETDTGMKWIDGKTIYRKTFISKFSRFFTIQFNSFGISSK